MIGRLALCIFCVLLLLSAWAISVFKKQHIPLMAAWVPLTACSITTAFANLNASAQYLSNDCTNSHSATASSFVVAMLVMYLPVAALFFTFLLALVSANLVVLRRKQKRKPLLFPRFYKVLHWIVLRILTFTSHPIYIMVHIALSATQWLVEPFLLLGAWHEVSMGCRDYRVFSICCAGEQAAHAVIPRRPSRCDSDIWEQKGRNRIPWDAHRSVGCTAGFSFSFDSSSRSMIRFEPQCRARDRPGHRAPCDARVSGARAKIRGRAAASGRDGGALHGGHHVRTVQRTPR